MNVKTKPPVSDRLPDKVDAAEDKAPYPLAGRQAAPEGSIVRAGGVAFGGQQVQVIAGPCAVESRAQILEVAHAVREAGAVALRGGAYKPRTSPHTFQGHGELGLQWMAEAREETGLAIVTEVLDPALVEQVAAYADILQVGARSMQNFALLRAVGQQQKPVLLKRGMSSTLAELIYSAEYIMAEGNPHVLLCERGIRTFAKETRNTFDLNAIPALKRLSHLPVIADPSHGTGKREYVPAMAKAAIAAGADGLLIEVHPQPEEAISDGRQSIEPRTFAELMAGLKRIAQAVDRSM